MSEHHDHTPDSTPEAAPDAAAIREAILTAYAVGELDDAASETLRLKLEEDPALQARSVELFEALAQESDEMRGYCDYAHRHARVVERFGRFPHRNDILERTSTYDEIQFLQSDEAPF